MKRHLFSVFVLFICAISWKVILGGGVQPVLSTSADVPVITEENIQTAIKGESQHTLEQAKAWAVSRGATEEFVNIADEYWRVGELMGIRPDVMYAQAAKETAFGNYGGNVTADMNNWAGIKTETASGDTREDHQTFTTPEAGVQGHYNHMAAYVGVEPVGMLHPRYYSVMSTAWAGAIMYAQQLGGKWAPALDYGDSVVNDFLNTM